MQVYAIIVNNLLKCFLYSFLFQYQKTVIKSWGGIPQIINTTTPAFGLMLIPGLPTSLLALFKGLYPRYSFLFLPVSASVIETASDMIAGDSDLLVWSVSWYDDTFIPHDEQFLKLPQGKKKKLPQYTYYTEQMIRKNDPIYSFIYSFIHIFIIHSYIHLLSKYSFIKHFNTPDTELGEFWFLWISRKCDFIFMIFYHKINVSHWFWNFKF